MADDGRREIKITGVAADAYHKTKGTRRAKRISQSKHIRQDGGEGEPPQPALTARPTNIKPFMNAVKIGGEMKVSEVKKIVSPVTEVKKESTPITIVNKETTTLSHAPEVKKELVPAKGRLILSPAKTKTKKVLLAAPVKKQVLKSRGETRKIRVQLSGLKKRLTKAKIIHHDSRDKPIAEVRKLLEEAKLIKPDVTGKVPDNVLRDIYKDYLLLRNRAL